MVQNLYPRGLGIFENLGIFIPRGLGIFENLGFLGIFYPSIFWGWGFFRGMGYPTKKPPLVQVPKIV